MSSTVLTVLHIVLLLLALFVAALGVFNIVKINQADPADGVGWALATWWIVTVFALVMAVGMIWNMWGRWRGDSFDWHNEFETCLDSVDVESRKLANAQTKHLRDLKKLRDEESKSAELGARLAAVQFQEGLAASLKSSKLKQEDVRKIQRNIKTLADENARVSDRVGALQMLSDNVKVDKHTLRLVQSYLDYANADKVFKGQPKKYQQNTTTVKIRELEKMMGRSPFSAFWREKTK
jgi:hypothetical protein